MGALSAVALSVMLLSAEGSTLVTGTGCSPSSASEPGSGDAFAGKVGSGLMLVFDSAQCRWVLGGVWPGSPAEKAGLREGDIILEIADVNLVDERCDKQRRVEIGDRFQAKLQSLGVGGVASVIADRKGKRIQKDVRLEDLSVLFERAMRLEEEEKKAPSRKEK